MINLSGRNDCDDFIRSELEVARIPIIQLEKKNTGEVPYTLIGRLRSWEFWRAWYYYVARGDPLPLDLARQLYTDPAGKRDVRVKGHAGRVPPEEPVILYHVDSELGLRLLADAILKQESDT